jgi:hypothetical protein
MSDSYAAGSPTNLYEPDYARWQKVGRLEIFATLTLFLVLGAGYAIYDLTRISITTVGRFSPLR